MRRSSESWNPLFERLSQLKTAWPSRGWSWDSRLESVTSSFGLHFETEAKAAALIALPTQWTPAALTQAPAPLRELAEKSGGIRAAQLIFTDDPRGEYSAFGLWWPWGNGMTISLRVGLAEHAATQAELQRLRDLFGVQL